MKVYIKGLNTCPMRRQNLQHYREFFSRNGHALVEDPAESDVTIVWTCAFRGDVLENSLAELARYKKAYRAEIIAAGCVPDIAPEKLAQCFNGRVIPWKHEAAKLEGAFGPVHSSFSEARPIFAEEAVCRDAAAYRKAHPGADVTFHDQFIKLLVSEGCPFACTYCTERLAFPPFRSFPEEKLVEACRRLVEETGQTRVILLSDCLGEYGRDIGSSLPLLLRKLHTVHPDLTFALNNLHPTHFLEYFDELRDLVRDGWICHLNLPVQSASDRILKMMNRLYARKDLERIFAMLNEVGFRDFDTHVIVGFPGETEEDFLETVSVVLRYRLKYVLLSMFFEATNAPAARLPAKVSGDVMLHRVERARRAFQEAGIICNWEGSELFRERLERLNRSSESRGETSCLPQDGNVK